MDVASNNHYPTPYGDTPILPIILMTLAVHKNAPRTSDTFKDEYDYIVVGGGSAGSVVASRLSEIPCVNVLLLEAGKSPPLVSDIPFLYADFFESDIDWNYTTVPQKNAALANNNNQLKWPSGKTLGGSSTLNAMLYTRGNMKNYDDWKAEGAEGWGADDVYGYFLKMEDNTDPNYLANGYHGRGGPLTVETTTYVSEIKNPLLKAAKELGYEVVDANGPTQTGFYDPQDTIRSGQRCSTAKAYLVPAENRSNIDIVTNAFVTKILFENRRAVGVRFDYKNETYEVKASKEVIISAGTVNTPQLLMLSGIGPKDQLKEFNIETIQDLPVGENLQDHCGTFLPFNVDSSIPNLIEKVLDNQNATEQYIHNKTGLLSSTGFVLVAFLKNQSTSIFRTDFPNFQLYFNEAIVDSLQLLFRMKQDVYDKVYAPYLNTTSYTCISQLLQPKSRGSIRLKSANPYDYPLIDPNYLDDPRDVADIVEGLKVCNSIGTSAAMKEIGSKQYQTRFPGCEGFSFDGDEFYECLLRSMTLSIYNPVGTARMGNPDDPRTVVDPQLRVKGVEGLRVVDASVMPIIPSGNTNVPTIMIAEKASDIIKSGIICI